MTSPPIHQGDQAAARPRPGAQIAPERGAKSGREEGRAGAGAGGPDPRAGAGQCRRHPLARAEGRAIAAKAKAFQDNPGYTNLIAVESWNGTLPHTMLPGSALPFISIPQGETPSTAPAPPRPAAAATAPRPQ
jgi:hypothetical protein